MRRMSAILLLLLKGKMNGSEAPKNRPKKLLTLLIKMKVNQPLTKRLEEVDVVVHVEEDHPSDIMMTQMCSHLQKTAKNTSTSIKE